MVEISKYELHNENESSWPGYSGTQTSSAETHSESSHARTGSSVHAVMTGSVSSRPGRDPEDYKLIQVFKIYLVISHWS